MGTMAIAGIPLFSGFFSKDGILSAVFHAPHYGRLLWTVGVIAAGFTSFYMFRLLILTFMGSPRYTHHDVHHVHESPTSMLLPLVVLAILSIIGGYVGVPKALGGSDQIEHFLAAETGPWNPSGPGEVAEASQLESHTEEVAESTEYLLMAGTIGAALLGLSLAYLFYAAKPELPVQLAAKAQAAYSLLVNKYYIDEIYDAVIVWPVVRMAREFLWKFVDVILIDGSVNGVGGLVRFSGRVFRRMQTGYVRTYAGWILFGGILVVAWFLR